VKVAQGVTGTVVDKGSVVHLVQYLMQSLLHSFQELGCKNIHELHKGLYEGTLRFEMRSPSAQAEGSVHNLYSFKEPHLGFLRMGR
ncbi:MAG: IMP dehydrogenase, partial [Candidatus Brocadiales bacterium]|nr:IMP dehydrogenase [Candidatus Brocadiales bacterium]